MSGWARHRRAALVAVTALALALSACARGEGTLANTAASQGPATAALATSVVDKARSQGKLVIGVHYDLPGMGQVNGPSVNGAEIDFARQIAQSIGGPEVKVEFVEAPPPERDRLVQEGRVDLLVATFSMLAERKQKVTLGGPYIIAHQDTLVRAEDSSITKAKDLAGKRLCKVEGSNSWKRVIDDKKIPAELVTAQTYPDCFAKLRANQLDAVSTDDVILAGFAARQASAYRFLNDPFTEEKYGVGIRKGDLKTCEAVNKAIGEMYRSGAAKSILDKWFSRTNLKLSYTLPTPENCD